LRWGASQKAKHCEKPFFAAKPKRKMEHLRKHFFSATGKGQKFRHGIFGLNAIALKKLFLQCALLFFPLSWQNYFL